MQSFSSGGGAGGRSIAEFDVDLWCAQCMCGPPHSYASCPHQANPQSVYTSPYYHSSTAAAAASMLPYNFQMPSAAASAANPAAASVSHPHQSYYMPWVSRRYSVISGCLTFCPSACDVFMSSNWFSESF